MTDDVPDARPGLYDVLQVSNQLLCILHDILVRGRYRAGPAQHVSVPVLADTYHPIPNINSLKSLKSQKEPSFH